MIVLAYISYYIVIVCGDDRGIIYRIIEQIKKYFANLPGNSQAEAKNQGTNGLASRLTYRLPK